MGAAAGFGGFGVDRRFIAFSARSADRFVIAFRDQMGRQLDGLHVALRRVEAKHDPETKVWMDGVKAALADGSIWAQIESQPSPEELVEQYHQRG